MIEGENKYHEYAAAKRRTRIGNSIFDLIIYIVLGFLVVVTIYPFWNTIAISLNDGLDSLKGGITLWPRKFTITIRICFKLHVFVMLVLFL